MSERKGYDVRIAELKKIAPLLAAGVEFGATLLAVIVTNLFNLRVASSILETERQPARMELRAALPFFITKSFSLDQPHLLSAGNHDRHAEESTSAPLDLGPFRLCHEPTKVPGKHTLAGHLPPAHTLAVARDKLRAPVLWFREGVTVLPSFGALTGGWDIKPDTAEDAVLVVNGELFRLSGGR